MSLSAATGRNVDDLWALCQELIPWTALFHLYHPMFIEALEGSRLGSGQRGEPFRRRLSLQVFEQAFWPFFCPK